MSYKLEPRILEKKTDLHPNQVQDFFWTLLACFRDSILDSNILAPRLRIFNLLNNPILHSTFSGTPKAILVPRIRWPGHTFKQNDRRQFPRAWRSQTLRLPLTTIVPKKSFARPSTTEIRNLQKERKKRKIRTKRALQQRVTYGLKNVMQSMSSSSSSSWCETEIIDVYFAFNAARWWRKKQDKSPNAVVNAQSS